MIARTPAPLKVCAYNDLRCDCGSLLFIVAGTNLEIKCKRCRHVFSVDIRELLAQ